MDLCPRRQWASWTLNLTNETPQEILGSVDFPTAEGIGGYMYGEIQLQPANSTNRKCNVGILFGKGGEGGVGRVRTSYWCQHPSP
jgi:hypothetical protein